MIGVVILVEKKQYPILEFDSCRSAYIEPSNLIKPIDIPECCVISFFRDVIEMKKNNGQLKQVANFHSEHWIFQCMRLSIMKKELHLY